jgi:hypothetical protein
MGFQPPIFEVIRILRLFSHASVVVCLDTHHKVKKANMSLHLCESLQGVPVADGIQQPHRSRDEAALRPFVS